MWSAMMAGGAGDSWGMGGTGGSTWHDKISDPKTYQGEKEVVSGRH